MIRVLVIIFLIFSSYSLVYAEVGSVQLSLNYNFQLPENNNPLPCVIICPGRGYHKELPLIKDLADRIVQEGFAAVRFDWTFFTNNSEPSADGEQEFRDIAQIINMVKSNPKIDTTRIYMAGKSLGSLFAYAVFHENMNLKGCLLLTPILPDSNSGSDYYPDLINEQRHVVFILGNEDFSNCRLNHLYNYLAKCNAPIPVVVLGGAHSFNVTAQSESPQVQTINALNLKTAIEASVYWLKTFENIPPIR